MYAGTGDANGRFHWACRNVRVEVVVTLSLPPSEKSLIATVRAPPFQDQYLPEGVQRSSSTTIANRSPASGMPTYPPVTYFMNTFDEFVRGLLGHRVTIRF